MKHSAMYLLLACAFSVCTLHSQETSDQSRTFHQQFANQNVAIAAGLVSLFGAGAIPVLTHLMKQSRYQSKRTGLKALRTTAIVLTTLAAITSLASLGARAMLPAQSGKRPAAGSTASSVTIAGAQNGAQTAEDEGPPGVLFLDDGPYDPDSYDDDALTTSVPSTDLPRGGSTSETAHTSVREQIKATPWWSDIEAGRGITPKARFKKKIEKFNTATNTNDLSLSIYPIIAALRTAENQTDIAQQALIQQALKGLNSFLQELDGWSVDLSIPLRTTENVPGPSTPPATPTADSPAEG